MIIAAKYNTISMYGKWIYFAVCYIVIGLDVPKQKSNQRNGQCARFMGVDIGVYDTCGHLCKYCYANANTGLVKANMKRHDPKSPFLIGGDMPGDIIHVADQKNWIDGQMSLKLD